jgi:LPS-assembly lipoprotein
MMQLRNVIAGLSLIGLALSISACGFKPLYAPSGATNAELSQVFVAVIPNRDGQLLRQALQEHLDGNGLSDKTYILQVQYSLQYSSEGIQQDTSISRNRYIGTAHWVLRKPGPLGEKVASGSERNLDGSNAINSQFFYGDLSGEAINRRMADALASQITEKLAAYFRANAAPA